MTNDSRHALFWPSRSAHAHTHTAPSETSSIYWLATPTHGQRRRLLRRRRRRRRRSRPPPHKRAFKMRSHTYISRHTACRYVFVLFARASCSIATRRRHRPRTRGERLPESSLRCACKRKQTIAATLRWSDTHTHTHMCTDKFMCIYYTCRNAFSAI